MILIRWNCRLGVASLPARLCCCEARRPCRLTVRNPDELSFRRLSTAMAEFLQSRRTRKIHRALFVALMIVGSSGQAFALIGGRSDHPERFPATVRFEGAVNYTATIVGARTILTAGHCLDKNSPPDFMPGNVEFGRKSCWSYARGIPTGMRSGMTWRCVGWPRRATSGVQTPFKHNLTVIDSSPIPATKLL